MFNAPSNVGYHAPGAIGMGTVVRSPFGGLDPAMQQANPVQQQIRATHHVIPALGGLHPLLHMMLVRHLSGLAAGNPKGMFGSTHHPYGAIRRHF